MREMGLSRGVLVSLAVFLILVSVIIVLFVSFFGQAEVDPSFDDLNLSIVSGTGHSVYDPESRLAIVEVSRGNDNEKLRAVLLTFEFEGKFIKHIKNAPGVNSSVYYYVNLSDYLGALKGVKIAPVFFDDEIGDVVDELGVGRLEMGDISAMIESGNLSDGQFEKPNEDSGSGSGGGDKGDNNIDDETEPVIIPEDPEPEVIECASNSDCSGGDYCSAGLCIEIVSADYYVDSMLDEDCLGGNYSIVDRDCNGSDGIAYNTFQEGVDVAVAGDLVLIRGGKYHEEIEMVNSGEPGNYIVFSAYPRETPSVDASVVLGGWRKCSSQSDCLGNPNWRDIYYASVPVFKPPYGVVLYEGDTMAKVSMYPDQSDRLYIDQVSDFKEFERLEGCSDFSIRDPDYLTSENLPYWNQSYVSVWNANNRVNQLKINSFEASNNRVVFDEIDCIERYNRYAILNNIMALSREGEFYLHNSSHDLKIYYWPHDEQNILNNKMTYSTLDYGFNFKGRGFIELNGLEIIKQAQGTGDARKQGKAIVSYPGYGSAPYSNVRIIDNTIYGIKGTAVGLSYCSNCVVEGNTIYDVFGKGIILTGSRSSNFFITNTTINDNYVAKTQSTAIDYYAANDCNITNNVIVNATGQHGNSITVYENSSRVLIEGNKAYNSNSMTFNYGYNHTIRGNFANKGGINCWATDQHDYLIEQNTFAGLIGCGNVNNHHDFVIRDNILGSGVSDHPEYTYYNNLYYGLSWDRKEYKLNSSEVYYPNPELLFVNVDEDDYRIVDSSFACTMSSKGSYVGAFPCVKITGCDDLDGDGFYAISDSCVLGLATDCDDNNPNANPGGLEVCGNGVDEDCRSGDLECLTVGSVVLNMTFEGNLEDSSGFDNFGVAVGDNISFGQGKVGQGLEVPGVHPNHVLVSTLNNTLRTGDDYNYTVMAWAKTNNPEVKDQSVFNGLGCPRTYGGSWRFCQNGQSCSSFEEIEKDRWYHLAITSEGDSGSFFIDGVLKRTLDSGLSLENNSNGYQFYIGGGIYKGDFNGTIDEVLVYSRALSEGEIHDIYCSQGGDC